MPTIEMIIAWMTTGLSLTTGSDTKFGNLCGYLKKITFEIKNRSCRLCLMWAVCGTR